MRTLNGLREFQASGGDMGPRGRRFRGAGQEVLVLLLLWALLSFATAAEAAFPA